MSAGSVVAVNSQRDGPATPWLRIREGLLAFSRKEQEPSAALLAVARQAIARVEGGPVREQVEAESALAFELAGRCEDILRQFEAHDERLRAATGSSPILHDGIFLPDAIAANLLKGLGKYGGEVAVELREKSSLRCRTDTWHLWYEPKDGSIPFLPVLARVLWRDIVKERVRLAKHPALSRQVLDKCEEALWRKKRRVVLDEDKRLVLALADGRPVGLLRNPTVGPLVVAEVSRSLPATRSLTGHRLFRYLVVKGYERCYLYAERDFRKILVPHGFTGLAHELGIKGAKAADEIRRTLQFMQCLQVDLPHGQAGGLLTWTFTPASSGRPASLDIVLGDPLLPEYVVALAKNTLRAREARRLVPLPSRLPPLVGRPADHAAQASLQMHVMALFRDHAGELVQSGRVRIAPEEWERMARQAGLPVKSVDPVIERWCSDADDGPAFLRSATPGFFTLAVPTYDRELQMIVEAGKAEREGRARAKRRRKPSRSDKGRKHSP